MQAGSRTWTHAGLRDLADLLARTLGERGVGPGDMVAVRMARGPALVVAMLALGKIGATYVPVNARLPRARIAEMLAALGCAAILRTRDDLDQDDDRDHAAVVIDVETDAAAATGGANATGHTGAAPPLTLPDYVIHTSGSTGRSKPVLVGREGLHHHVAAIGDAYRLQSDDRVLQVCSPAFDVSIEEILPTLAAGGRVVFAPELADVGMAGFAAFLATAGITVANLPTALWCGWLDYMAATGSAPPPALRLCVIGGEACPPARVAAWRRLAPGVRCLNAYGLTETTITNCMWPLAPRADDGAPVPVGHPLAGNRLHVLDASMQPAPPGTHGELHIAGPWLAHGYVGDPALTADRYRPHPFPSRPGERLFRTGDRAFVDDDGAVVVVGRIDRQLKLHGYRLEPAEIEAVLLTHSALAFCHVAAVGDGEHRVLVAAAQLAPGVVAATGLHGRASAGLASELSTLLRQRLADYAVPSRYLFVRDLPFTSTGKVDVAALVEVCRDDAEPSVADDDDRLTDDDGCPRAVRACFDRVLGRQADLGRGFYEAGGDSVLALRLVAAVRQAGFDLSLKDLMSGRSIAAVFASLPSLAPGNAPGEAPRRQGFVVGTRLERGELAQLHANTRAWRDTEFLCAASPMQAQMLALSIDHPRSGNCIEQVEGRLQGIDPDRLRQAWEMAARRHEAMRSYFNLRFPGRPLQVCRKQAPLDWQVHDWRGLDEATRATRLASLLHADRHQDFRLLDHPLMRWQLLLLDDDDVHFVWTYHHALLDGWSDVMILREVFAHYRDGGAAALPPAGSYRDYAHWLAGRDASVAAAYWRGCLAGLGDGRGWLLADASQQRRAGDHGVAKRGLRLDAGASRALGARARAANIPASALYAAEFGAALRHVRATDVAVFGQFVWVRPPDLTDLPRTAGMFVNLVPVVSRRSAGATGEARARDMLRKQHDRESHLWLASDAITATAPPSPGVPLLDAAIVVENYPEDGDPAIASLRSHAQSTVPLTCYVWPGDTILLEVAYDRARLSESTATALLDAFARRLADPDATVPLMA
ncbi:MAG: amino acid adenylation domain-containing protein [Stenotrophomonas sp.]